MSIVATIGLSIDLLYGLHGLVWECTVRASSSQMIQECSRALKLGLLEFPLASTWGEVGYPLHHTCLPELHVRH